jgi:type I restriction enzyme, S subunit
MSTSTRMIQLDRVAEFVRGITFKPDDKVDPFSDGSVVCFRTSNVQEALDQSDLIAVPEDFVKREEQFVSEGDILVSTANSWNLVGKCSWVPKISYRAAIGGFISILRANRGLIDPKYLYYWFNSRDIQTLVRSFGRQTTNISNMDVARVLKLQIPLPSLSEQQRIAAILDCADALRAKRRAALAKLDDLLQATFIDMFGDPVLNPKGWDIQRLEGYFAQDKEGTKCGPFGSALKKDEYIDDGVPVWVMDNIRDMKFRPEGSLFISDQKFEELRSYAATEGDIIISRAGTVGKMCVVESSIPHAIISTNLIRLSLDQRALDPYYFVSLMTFFKGRVGRLKTGEDGAYSFMNTGILKTLMIPVPPIQVQRQYRQAWAKIRQQEVVYRGSSAKLQTLFHALQQRAFRGDL